jgi:ribosomal protein L34E
MTKRNPDKDRSRNLKRKFGITVDQYDDMVKTQNETCAICNKPEQVIDVRFTNKAKRLTVDHEHSTGRVRGLLCSSCNRALGLFGDDPKLTAAATVYLLKK